MAPGRVGCPASAVLIVTLAAVQLLLYVDNGSRQAWVDVLAGAGCLLVVPIAAALWTGRMRECRFFAVLLALCVGGVQVLASTVGSPGGVPLGWSPGRALVVALAVVVVPVVLRPTWSSRGAEVGGGAWDPYASSDVTAAAGRGGRRRHRRAAATDVGA